MFADPLIKGPHVQFNDRLVRDDVLFCTRLQHSNGQHGGIGRTDFPRDNRLQPYDGRGSHDDGINARLWHGAMRSTPEHSNLKAVGSRGHNASTPI